VKTILQCREAVLAGMAGLEAAEEQWRDCKGDSKAVDEALKRAEENNYEALLDYYVANEKAAGRDPFGDEEAA
jgi:hypothetical protein